MKGRLLPASRTDRFARPVGTTWIEHDDCVQLDTPGHRKTWSGHSLVLDSAPDDLLPWRERWRELNGGKGVTRAMVAWEGRFRVPVEVPDGADHYKLWALMCDQPIDAADGPATIVELDDTALDDLIELGRAEGGEHAPDDWPIRGWLARAAAGQGHVWGARIDGQLVGVCCVFTDGREGRTQWISTHRDHRRKGVCTQILTHAIQHYQDEYPGIVYTVAEEDSDGERLYRSLGWRRVTALDEVIFPEEADSPAL